MKIRIKIRNCSNRKMSITKEPEAVEGYVDKREEIEVETNEQEDNISIDVGENEDGTIYVQIWDALGTRYVILKDGENMFKDYM